MNEFNAPERRGAGLQQVSGMQQATIHVAMFMELLAAQQAGKSRSWRTFMSECFHFTCARLTTHGWRRSLLKIRRPIRTPFVPNLYEVRGTREAAEANAKAATSLQNARNAGNVSGQNLANTVLFATVLFFASASGKFEQRRVRVVAFAFAVAVFAFTVVRTVMLPR